MIDVKNSWRTLFVCIVTLVLTFSLIACGGNQPVAQPQQPSNQSQSVATSDPEPSNPTTPNTGVTTTPVFAQNNPDWDGLIIEWDGLETNYIQGVGIVIVDPNLLMQFMRETYELHIPRYGQGDKPLTSNGADFLVMQCSKLEINNNILGDIYTFSMGFTSGTGYDVPGGNRIYYIKDDGSLEVAFLQCFWYSSALQRIVSAKEVEDARGRPIIGVG